MKMWTNSKGVSYYKSGKKYFKNTGWLEREITENEYKKELEKEIYGKEEEEEE